MNAIFVAPSRIACATRFNYVYKPVLDDADWRSFNSMADYRQWCHENLPEYLGYGELSDLQRRVLDET